MVEWSQIGWFGGTHGYGHFRKPPFRFPGRYWKPLQESLAPSWLGNIVWNIDVSTSFQVKLESMCRFPEKGLSPVIIHFSGIPHEIKQADPMGIPHGHGLSPVQGAWRTWSPRRNPHWPTNLTDLAHAAVGCPLVMWRFQWGYPEIARWLVDFHGKIPSFDSWMRTGGTPIRWCPSSWTLSWCQ